MAIAKNSGQTNNLGFLNGQKNSDMQICTEIDSKSIILFFAIN